MVNRIIGILVLLAVGVLVSPFLVNHYDTSLEAEMVKAPSFPNRQDQSNTIQALGERDATTPVINTRTSKNSKTKGHAIKVADGKLIDKTLKAGLKNSAWVVQLGTYKDKLSALRLVNQLRAKGYNAFIHQKGAAFGEEVNVYIGPEGKKDLAESLATKLAKETNLSTVIKSYKPLTA